MLSKIFSYSLSDRERFDQYIFASSVLNENLNGVGDGIINSYDHPVFWVSSWLQSALDLISWVWWWLRLISQIVVFMQFNSWPETSKSQIERFRSVPLPLSPSICCAVPGSTIVLEINWPHFSSVEVWGNGFIFKNSEFLGDTVVTIYLRDLCAWRFTVSDYRVVGQNLTYLSCKWTVLIWNNVIVGSCAIEFPTASEPSSPR